MNILCAGCGAAAGEPAQTCPQCGEPTGLRDRYTLVEQVGRGAAGTTYRALDARTGAVVAVKEVPLRLSEPEVTERLEREARVLRELDHDRVPRYVEHFTTGTGKRRTFYLVQSFIEGRSLADEMAAKRYTEDEVLAILDEVLAILDDLHQLRPPIIHRDVKPGNIIRRTDGRLVLLDFGAVRDIVQDPRIGGSTIAGTYGFMAPEQFRGVATPRTDLYAVGALGVVLLSRKDLLDLVRSDHSLDWEGHVHASEGLRVLLERLLSPSPEMRPASAASARERIAALRRGEGPEPVPRPALGTAQPPDVAPHASTPMPLPLPLSIPLSMPLSMPLSKVDRKRVGARSRWVALLLATLGGFWGLHNWYLYRPLRGIFSLVFSVTLLPLLLSLWDARRFFRMSDADFDERYNPALIELEHGKAFSAVEQVRQLHALRVEGALTDDEFEHEKRRVLDRETPGLEASLRDGLDRLMDRLQDVSSLPKAIIDELEKTRRRR